LLTVTDLTKVVDVK